jgi:hypothetical protein
MAPLPVESSELRSREANPSLLGRGEVWRVGIGELSGAEALLAEREGYCTVAILLRKMSGAGRRVGTAFGLRRRTEDSPPYLPWEGRPTEDTEHTEREGLLARKSDPSVTFREFRGPNLLFLGQREQRNQPPQP